MKIFIIGLPRTGTTSLCATLLEYGFKVAHTAYTKAAIEQADVIADTPVYCDYIFLDQQFPGSKFIYLDRKIENWLPSIQNLLRRMIKNINNDHGGFNVILKRCYKTVFAPFDHEHINNLQHLSECYKQHKNDMSDHFAARSKDLLFIDIANPTAPQQLVNFLAIKSASIKPFPHLNKGQSIIAWNKIKSPLKISANLSGDDGRKYY